MGPRNLHPMGFLLSLCDCCVLDLPSVLAQREGQGHNSRKEKVEIPSGEDYAAPSAFREDLLKAMKRKTDDANQDAVKRYYRSLVE